MPRQLIIAAFLLLALAAAPARAADAVTVDGVDATAEFPGSLTFTARASAGAGLKEVVLEYGVEQRTCGDVTARAFPTFEPGTSADVSWTWDMRQSGSVPPGATIWYRWVVTDESGATAASPRSTVTWLDREHRWRTLSRPGVNLHWYEGDDAFASDLAGSASASLARLEREIGFTPGAPIDLYIYASSNDMREAVLYEPGWTGGLAYAENNLTIIGISPDNLDWGRRTAAHELTHVLVGNRAFSCFANIPTWLNEGIAVYGEGGPEPAAAEQLDRAIADDTVLSVRALSAQFSEDPSQADLSYSQSYSIVNYLIGAYGRDKLLQLFTGLSGGARVEQVMQDVYGFGLDGLEDRWRASVGARPRQEPAETPAPAASPSPIPTLEPVGGPPAAPQTTAGPDATAAVAERPTDGAPDATPAPAAQAPATAPGGPRSPLLLAVGALLALAAVVGTIAFAVTGRRRGGPPRP